MQIRREEERSKKKILKKVAVKGKRSGARSIVLINSPKRQMTNFI